MTVNKTDYAAMLKDPQFENVRSLLRTEIVPTRQLGIITSQMARAQQQVAARFNTGSFFSGDNSLPMDGVLFVGESGSGKSFGIKYATETLPPIQLLDGTLMDSKARFVDTPAQGTVATLAKEILRVADGYPIMREPKDQDAPGKVSAALGRHKFTMFVIDEISRVINPQRHSTRALTLQSHLVWTMAIQALNLGTWPTPIALSGLPHVLDSFLIVDKKEDAQKVRREAHRRRNPPGYRFQGKRSP